MADSTNILSKQTESISEKEVYLSLLDICSLANRNIYISTFSSNIFRIKSILKIARLLNKKVVLKGYSIESYINSAIKCNILNLTVFITFD